MKGIEDKTNNGNGNGDGGGDGIIITDNENDDNHDDFSETTSSRGAMSTAETSAEDDESQISGVSSQKFVLASKETTNVNLSKLLVIFVLFILVTVAAVLTYIVSNNQVKNDFETQFEEYANEVATVSKLNARDLFDAYYTLSLAFTSSAIATNSTWPFVTIPLFEALANRVQARVNARLLGILPFVTEENKEKWEKYSVENQWWVHESRELAGLPPTNQTIVPFIFDWAPDRTPIPPNDPPRPTYAPIWQSIPAEDALRVTNYERYIGFAPVFDEVRKVNNAVFSPVVSIRSESTGRGSWPHSILAQPVHDKLKGQQSIVAVICAYIPWHVFFENILPDGVGDILLNVNNNCGQNYTYTIQGPNVEFVDFGEFHEQEYEHLEYSTYNTTWKTQEGCAISLHFYPTDDFHDQYTSNRPMLYTVGVVVVFLITAIVFELYDCLVQKRQQTIMTSAAQSHAIVNSFFPSHVRDQILENQGADGQQTNKKGFVTDTGKPIAELHPHCTIMIADIANFTAWSSAKQPSQVFTLLETLYSAFDVIAKKRQVFKVETIGDAYVAVAGLPEPRDDHAIVMARFAHTCISRMREVVLELETSLGPDTAELTMRFGLHSGPVTAGVLRGERARFQLFGDTINTAARIESTGIPNEVHLSEQAAKELKAAGKGHWVVRREEKVMAKGKGELQTYWLEMKSFASHMNNKSTGETESSQNSSSMEHKRYAVLSGKEERLVSWHVDVLSKLLKQIVAMRPNKSSINKSNTDGAVSDAVSSKTKSADMTVLDEVKEIIPLPNKKARSLQDPTSIELSPEVMKQLRRYVDTIASMYRPNAFHSFEHASHVAQSLTKLLSRVVAVDTTVDYTNMSYRKTEAEKLHKFTYGIASDPLTQFACAFSALIHDVDHRGVPNTRLVQEEPDLAKLYKRQSVAEQNSVDLSWELLMEPEFKDLRALIYINQDELDRFRQLVVNSVMATDIVDKELGQLRKNRWNKAFHIDTAAMDGISLEDESEQDTINRKATIVIEHLIQAADVAHTMQHWHVYLKWNERFFHENYQAYLDGRLEKDPSIGWYEGEIGFLDFYIIPLAKKLESCGVFGVSSDECLDYATANRNEWEVKGKGIVEKYILRYKK